MDLCSSGKKQWYAPGYTFVIKKTHTDIKNNMVFFSPGAVENIIRANRSQEMRARLIVFDFFESITNNMKTDKSRRDKVIHKKRYLFRVPCFFSSTYLSIW